MKFINCENFLDVMDVYGKSQNLIDYIKPEKCLILESFGKKNALKVLYILNLMSKSIFKMVKFIIIFLNYNVNL